MVVHITDKSLDTAFAKCQRVAVYAWTYIILPLAGLELIASVKTSDPDVSFLGVVESGSKQGMHFDKFSVHLPGLLVTLPDKSYLVTGILWRTCE